MRRLELDILFVATRAAILLLVPLYISDLGLYMEYARNLIPGHQLPYLHWDFEYPPLAYPLIAIPAWIHDALGMRDSESYRLLFGLVLLPFDLLLYLRFRYLPSFRGAAFAYILLTCSMALLIYDRFDLLVGFMIAFPFLRRETPSDLKCAVSFGLGGALKLVPLSLAPLPPLEWQGAWSSRAVRLLKYGLVVSAPILLSVAVAAILGKGKISFLSHHSQRGVQIESLVGSIVMFAQSFFHVHQSPIDNSFGAQHLGETPGAILASRILFIGAMSSAYLLLVALRARYSLLAKSWLVILAFVSFGYVLSPQFLLWLIPVGLLAAGEVQQGGKRKLWLCLFCTAIVFTGTHFRYYWDYVNLHHLSVLIVLSRNLLLAAVWLLSWCWMAKKTAGTV